MKYVIHIGPRKTGSTYLQYSFTKHKAALRDAGIYYPTEFWPVAPNFKHVALRVALQAPDESLARIFAAFASSGAEIVLLSCEGFAELSPKDLVMLHALTAPAPVEIVFFARRWSDWIPSNWQLAVRLGSVVTFPEDYAELSRHDNPYININLILDRFATIFGGEAIRILPYSTLMDDGRDILEAFCANILAWDPPRRDAPVQILNPSVDASTTELIRCLNRLEQRRPGTRPVARLWPVVRDLMTDPAVAAAAARVFDVMRNHVCSLEIRDDAEPLRAIFADINNAYGDRIIGADSIFEPRRRAVDYVSQDFLLEPGGLDAVLAIHHAVTARITAPGLAGQDGSRQRPITDRILPADGQ